MAKSDILSWRLQPPAISTIRPIIAFEGARALYLGPALGLKREITIQRGFPGHSSLRHITFQRPWPRAEKSICMSNAKWQA
jgi:hypothetical protein